MEGIVQFVLLEKGLSVLFFIGAVAARVLTDVLDEELLNFNMKLRVHRRLPFLPHLGYFYKSVTCNHSLVRSYEGLPGWERLGSLTVCKVNR